MVPALKMRTLAADTNQGQLNIILEKAMAPHSSTLAWKIPWMEEPGGLPSMGLHRVGQDSDTTREAEHAAAKSLQLCLTLCDPIDGSPPGSPVPGILQARHWSGFSFPSPMHESEVAQSCPTLSDPMDCSLPGS